MSPEEYMSYLRAFPGDYRKIFVEQRARIYQQFDEIDDQSTPYRNLIHLLIYCTNQLGYKDSLAQALVGELAAHAYGLELQAAGLRFETLNFLLEFKRSNIAFGVARDHWDKKTSLYSIDEDVRTYYQSNRNELDKEIAERWEPVR